MIDELKLKGAELLLYAYVTSNYIFAVGNPIWNEP